MFELLEPPGIGHLIPNLNLVPAMDEDLFHYQQPNCDVSVSEITLTKGERNTLDTKEENPPGGADADFNKHALELNIAHALITRFSSPKPDQTPGGQPLIHRCCPYPKYSAKFLGCNIWPNSAFQCKHY